MTKTYTSVGGEIQRKDAKEWSLSVLEVWRAVRVEAGLIRAAHTAFADCCGCGASVCVWRG